MTIAAQPEDFFQTKRQTNGMGLAAQPEDFFQTKRQVGGMWDDGGEGYPLEGPTPGDPDYTAPDGSTPAPGPSVTTEATSWYENPWVLGGAAVLGLLVVGYMIKRSSLGGAAESDINPWNGLNDDGGISPWDGWSSLGDLSGGCGCGG